MYRIDLMSKTQIEIFLTNETLFLGLQFCMGKVHKSMLLNRVINFKYFFVYSLDISKFSSFISFLFMILE